MKRTGVGVQIGSFSATEELGAVKTISAQSKVDTRTATALLVIGVIAVLALTFAPGTANGVEPTMADYAAFPPFMSATVQPNVLVILDNSTSMSEFAYKEVRGKICTAAEAYTGYQEGIKYFGYFDSDTCYAYDNVNHYFAPVGPTVDDPATPGV